MPDYGTATPVMKALNTLTKTWRFSAGMDETIEPALIVALMYACYRHPEWLQAQMRPFLDAEPPKYMVMLSDLLVTTAPVERQDA